MNIQTQSTVRPSTFVNAGGSIPVARAPWFHANRALLLRLSVLLIAVLLISVAAAAYISSQTAKAESAFSDAMDVYDTPLRQPGQPVDPNTATYGTAAERAKAAHPLFVRAADQYGRFKPGANACYFAGLTAGQMGDNAEAESDLKKAADSGDSGLRSLAKLALASLYRKTNREQQAIDLYQELIKAPTLTVPLSTARIALAETYETSRPEEARKLYAQIKDQDKTSAAAQIAAQKLEGKK